MDDKRMFRPRLVFGALAIAISTLILLAIPELRWILLSVFGGLTAAGIVFYITLTIQNNRWPWEKP